MGGLNSGLRRSLWVARIITLGCDVVNVRRRYSEIHAAVFGVSVRRVIDLVKGRDRGVCESCVVKLAGLEGELRVLEASIVGIVQEQDAPRTAEPLRAPLLQYAQALSQAIEALEGICRHLTEEGTGYREPTTIGPSPFNQEKIHYDYLIRDLESLGAKLNHLFSDY